MLTAKGIGGGSAKVTNGILQEMYATEWEIPARTFVETTPTLGSVHEPGLKVDKLWDSNIEPTYKMKLQLSEDRFLYCVQGESSDEYKAAVGKVNADDSITLVQSDITVLDTNSRNNREYVLGAIALNETLVLLVTSSFSFSGIYYQILSVVDSTVTVFKPLTKLLTPTNKGNGINDGKAYMITSSKILLLLEETDSKSTSGIVHQIYRLTITFDKSTNTVSYSDWNHIKQTSGFPNYGGVVLPNERFVLWYYDDTTSPKAYRCSILDFGGSSAVVTNTLNDVKVNFLVSNNCAAEINSPNLKLYEILEDKITLKSTCPVVDYAKGDKNTIYPADKIQQVIPIGNNCVLVLFLNQQNRDNYDSSGKYTGTSVLNVFYAAKVFQLTEDFYLVNMLPDSSTLKIRAGSSYSDIYEPYHLSNNRVMFRIRYPVNYSGDGQTAFLKTAEIQLALMKSRNKIDGLTKTACTKTKKGQVWMLKVLRLRELANIAVSNLSDKGLVVDSFSNVYSCEKTRVLKYSNDLDTVLWESPVTSGEFHTMTGNDDHMYVSTKDGYITCLNASDGSVAWKKLLTGGSTTVYGRGSCVYEDDETIYLCIGLTNNKVEIYEVTDTDMVLAHSFTYPTTSVTILQTAYRNGYIYTTSASATIDGAKKAYIRKHPADLSEQLWEVSCDDGIYGLAVDGEGNAFLGVDDHTFQKISADGNREFKIICENYVNGVVIDSKNRVYLGLSKAASGKNLLCYDKQGNELVPGIETDHIYSGIAVDRNDNVFAVGNVEARKFKIVEEPNL